MALEGVIEALGGAHAAAPQQSRQQAIGAAALRDLADPALGAEDSPAQQAEREQAMAKAYRMAAPQGGAIAFDATDRGTGTHAPAAQPWRRVEFGETGPGTDLDAAIGELSGASAKAEAKAKEAEGPVGGIPGNYRAKPPAPAPKTAAEALNADTPFVRKYLSGPLEAATSVVTGTLAAPVAAAAGLVRGVTGGKYGTAEGAREAQARAAEVLDALTYRPRTEEGAQALQTFSKAFDESKLGGLGPSEGMALGTAIANTPKGAVSQGLRLAAGADRPLAAPAAPAPGAAPAVAAGRPAFASAGAAGATPQAQGEALAAQARSPEVAAAVRKAAADPAFNLKGAERIVEADNLPVPVRLTKGQATQDPMLISNEMNRRGMRQAMVDRLNEQNKGLIENLDAIREQAAPDVYATSKGALGEQLIDAYKAKDAALNKAISARYQALRDANGGAFPMDAKAFAEAADTALHKALKAEFVPAGIERQLEGFKAGKPMNFEQFEAMRTNLANVMRSSADGNAKAAASIIRDALEELPMPAGAEHLKPLADAARAAARERFALLEADPAYKAVVRGKAGADAFIDKYVLNADRANIARMKENLSFDPAAPQAMSAGALARLREKAGISTGDARTEAFRAAGYNRALEALGPKLDVLFEPESKALVQRLGNVANYVKAQPSGSFVNNSNTAVTALAEIAQSGAEQLANKYTLGAYGVGKSAVQFVRERKALNESLQTGAGLRLKDVK